MTIDADLRLLHSAHAQTRDRDVQIVPILVPFMAWQDVERIGADLARAVAGAMAAHGWKLGRDVAILCSGDG